MQSVQEVRNWLKETLTGLVDDPHRVEVDLVEGKQAVIFEVVVAPRDIARVIGRKGQTADAIRSILTGMAGKLQSGQRFQLEILEPENV